MSDLTLHFVSSKKSKSELSRLLKSQEDGSEDAPRTSSTKNLDSNDRTKRNKETTSTTSSTAPSNANATSAVSEVKLSGKSFYEQWNAPWNAESSGTSTNSKKASQEKTKGGMSDSQIAKKTNTKNFASDYNGKSRRDAFDSDSDDSVMEGSDGEPDDDGNREFHNEDTGEVNETFSEDDSMDGDEDDTKIESTWDKKEDKKSKKRRGFASINDYIRLEDVETNRQNEKIISSFDTSDFKVRKQSDVFSHVTFADLEGKLNKGLYKNLTQFMKLDRLTFIQERSFLPIVENKDVLIKAETGSGKTMAYLLPVIQSLSEVSAKNQIKREQGTYAIVIAPTRELCIQIQKVAETLTTCFPWMVTSAIMGGDNPQKEKKRLKKGVTLLIATPGRLEDHLKNTKSFVYNNLRHIIMDEADRLLDLGFESTLKTIYHILGQNGVITSEKKPQTVLASATLTSKIRQLASWTLRNEVYAGFTQQEMSERSDAVSANEFTVPDQLQQHFMIVPCKLRLPALIAFLTEKTSEKARSITGQEKASKIILFFSSCASVDFHYQLFSTAHTKRQVVGEDGTIAIKKKKIIPVKLFKLHGDMPQLKRSEVYFEFLKAEEGILLCTDVAARGLDMPKTEWIIQYDPPGDPKEYLHRVGRTARLGFKGNSVLFLMPHEAAYIKLLRKYGIAIRKINTEIILENLAFLIERKSNDVFEMCASVQIQMEFIIKENEKLHIAAAQGFQDFVKSYTTHGKLTKFIFHPKSLHLGHLATAFGLKESPSEIKRLTFGRTKKEQKEAEVEQDLKRHGFEVNNKKKKRLTIPDENQICAPRVSAENANKKPRNVKLSVADRIKLYKDFQKNPADISIRPKIDVKAILQGGAPPSKEAKRNAESFNALFEANKRKRDAGDSGEKPAKKTKFSFSTKK